MSYNYLLDTYNYIEQRKEEVLRQSSETPGTEALEPSAAGRIEALQQFERFLSTHFDAKLPRRLARHRKNQQ